MKIKFKLLFRYTPKKIAIAPRRIRFTSKYALLLTDATTTLLLENNITVCMQLLGV